MPGRIEASTGFCDDIISNLSPKKQAMAKKQAMVKRVAGKTRPACKFCLTMLQCGTYGKKAAIKCPVRGLAKIFL
jgi:hypothetical protein